MKILNVSPLHFNRSEAYSANTISKQFHTGLLNTLPKDTVSFSGNQDNTRFDSFGLMQKDFDDKYNIKDSFNIDSTKDNNDKTVLNKFEFNFKNSDRTVQFFGQEKDFVKALREKTLKTKDFKTSDDSKFYHISFNDKNVYYELKYDKETGKLSNGSAIAVTKGNINSMERIEIKPSAQKPDSYAVYYKLIQKIKNYTAVEDTCLLYKSDKDIPNSSYTTKYLLDEKNGINKKQSFVKVYDEDGFAKNYESEDSSIVVY